MIKKIIVLTILSSFISCIYIGIPKNEFEQYRYSKKNPFLFQLKMRDGEEKKIESIIDLNSIYVNNYTVQGRNYKRYLKFYKNGRVAIYSGEKLPEGEFDPRKSRMGVYEMKNGKLYYEYFIYWIQSGHVKLRKEVFVDKNSNDGSIQTELIRPKSQRPEEITYQKFPDSSQIKILPDW
ncbi:hypothetical protein ACQ1PV_01345 [Ornithobacterium rhinotracheale]|uniref:hypothetical protein n=1 Tax=Ornithobacterium rhinotracheale TaxID=28251 RepID=UPI00129CBFCF|nr:hypothetical protein [Ornithobacterium rhinotracheale]MRI62495.1 hypothetical protein [Ornithobacterium rhinotracheale]MRJ07589.1 hypothetical protein [Ornithobacterium rhinotracheale]UOH78188.1 hypothetical protein MT996_01645 [Ornithobacterium rhinotracheale]